jgi:ribonucleoside-diphosphate reductase alpha subunit
MSSSMLSVIKRDGSIQPMRFDMISDRILELSLGLNVDPAYITMKVMKGLRNKMTTSEIDNLTAETAAPESTYNPDYDTLASRLIISDLYKTTNQHKSGNLYDNLNKLKNNVDQEGIALPLIHDDCYNFAMKHIDVLKKIIIQQNDNKLTYFAIKTLLRSYLYKNSVTKDIIERPQHFYMRVALGIHYPRPEEYANKPINMDDEEWIEKLEKDALNRTIETYIGLSYQKISHASPTYFNSGSPSPQMSSCFLLNIDDTLDHIYSTVKRTALLSKFAGGIAVHISDIRAKGSLIRSTNGDADGVVPLISVFDKTSSYVNQGGKRKGSFAMYLEPWHADVEAFLKLRLNDGGLEEDRCKKIFIALWIPDLFMKRCEEDGVWSLMCPDRIKNLTTTYGEEFENIYIKAEQEGKFVKQIKAKDLLLQIVESQANCGLPYMVYKDHVNKVSNQMNIGVIKGSNLCTEIVEYTDPNNVAVCNLGSISLPAYVKKEKNNTYIDWDEMGKYVRILTRNLNRLIDYGMLPIEEAKKTNDKQRAIAIGISGLQELLYEHELTWDDAETKIIDRKIAETLDYYSADESANLAQIYESYYYFNGSPISQGKLTCDMWNIEPITNYDWNGLREKVKNGMRNSLRVAYMPTAATAQILGNTESFEMSVSNFFTRKVLAGEFPVINKYLYRSLSKIGLWTRDIINKIVMNNGSIQKIDEIPEEIKRLYRTCWEYGPKIILDLSANRQAFIDQAQSLNIYTEDNTIRKLSSIHMYGYKLGLKTGSYYVHTKPADNAIKYTIDADNLIILQEFKKEENNKVDEKQYPILKKEIVKKPEREECAEDCISCSV